MESYLLLLFGGVFVFLGCFVWDSIANGTLRHEPSDWLGYSFLSVIVMLLGHGAKYLDDARLHPYRSSMIAAVSVLLLGTCAVFLWRKAAKWDENFRKGKPSHRHK